VKWLEKWLLHSVSDISPTFDLVLVECYGSR
jgi:hypothetical protein